MATAVGKKSMKMGDGGSKKEKEVDVKNMLDGTLQTNPSMQDLQTKELLAAGVSPNQIIVMRLIQANWFICAMGFTIVFNMILVVMAADAAAREEDAAMWVLVLDRVILGIFIVELAMRLFLLRTSFFTGAFNILDFVVVVLDVFVEIIRFASIDAAGLSFLRIARLARLTRAYRVMVMFPMLSGMCRDLLGAGQAVCWGCVLLAIVLTVWSILAVQLIHPLVKDLAEQNAFGECERCPRAFSSVMHSNLTFLQHIVAGDSWGQVTIPIIEAHPWTACFFIPVLVSIGLAIMNVILAVIVESAADCRQNDLVEVMKVKEQHFLTKSKELMVVCKALDTDGSGDLSLDELMAGFEQHLELSLILQEMGIDQEDLSTVFQIMDSDHSGQVNYSEFVRHIYKMKTADEHTMLSYIRHYVVEILRCIRHSETVPGMTSSMSDSVSASPSATRSLKLSRAGGDDLPASQEAAFETSPFAINVKDDLTKLNTMTATRVVDTTNEKPDPLGHLSSLCDAILASVKQDLSVEVRSLSSKCDHHTKLLETIMTFESPKGFRTNSELLMTESTNELLVLPKGSPQRDNQATSRSIALERGGRSIPGCGFQECAQRV